MAASPLDRSYISSAVYEDTYFPERNAAIPFKWETAPGRPKYGDGDDDEDADKDDTKDGSCMHIMSNESYDGSDHYVQKSHMRVPCGHVHAMSIYPLRLPPKLAPASPLHIKDPPIHSGARRLDHSEDRFDDDHQLQQSSDPHDTCILHAHRGFSRFSFRFRSLKPSTIVPIHKNYCMIRTHQQDMAVKDGCQASGCVVQSPVQERSQSFSHAAMHGGAVGAAAAAGSCSNVVVDASGRRCHSLINLQSACKALLTAHENNVDDHDDVDNDPSSMAAAAVWAGACILAATAVHDVVSADHHQRDQPCRVARKLRDLMQQSANFSEVGLPMSMMTLKKGGGSAMNDQNVVQFAPAAALTVSRSTKAEEEEEEVEAFLGESIKKSCSIKDGDEVESEPRLEDKATLESDDGHLKVIVKKKSFFKVFKHECVACWCPSSSL